MGGGGGRGRGRGARNTGPEGKMLMEVQETLNSSPLSIRYPDELPFARLFDPDVEPRQGRLSTGHT